MLHPNGSRSAIPRRRRARARLAGPLLLTVSLAVLVLGSVGVSAAGAPSLRLLGLPLIPPVIGASPVPQLPPLPTPSPTPTALPPVGLPPVLGSPSPTPSQPGRSHPSPTPPGGVASPSSSAPLPPPQAIVVGPGGDPPGGNPVTPPQTLGLAAADAGGGAPNPLTQTLSLAITHGLTLSSDHVWPWLAAGWFLILLAIAGVSASTRLGARRPRTPIPVDEPPARRP